MIAFTSDVPRVGLLLCRQFLKACEILQPKPCLSVPLLRLRLAIVVRSVTMGLQSPKIRLVPSCYLVWGNAITYIL